METMTSRERVLKAINHEPTDRIPIDFGGMHNLTTMHKDAYKNLAKYLGIDEPAEISSALSQSIQPNKALLERFHSDCYPLYFPLTREQKDPTVHPDGSMTYTCEWGFTWKCPKNGLYFDPVTHPLEGIEEIEEIEAYPFPGVYPDEVYEELGRKAREIRETTDYAIVMNPPMDGNTMYIGTYLMGTEDFYVQMIADPDLVKALLDKIADWHCAHWTKIMEYAGEYIDIVRMADDLGSQKAPLINPDSYREVVMPAHKKIVNHIRSLKPDVKIVYHCDGSIREFLPFFIEEVGFDCWNPVQVSADGMDDTAWLKKTYGDKITFWGAGCDSQQVIAKCTPDEIREEVRRRINDLAAGGGLILGSIHNLQKNVPPENMVAFYDAICEYSVKYYENGGTV